MMGVINIVTRSESELALEGGSYGRRHASLQTHGEGVAGKLDFYARYEESEGESYTLFQPIPTPGAPSLVRSTDPYHVDDMYLHGTLGEFSLAARSHKSNTQDFYYTGNIDNDYNNRETLHDYLNIGWQHAFNQVTLEGHVFHDQKDLRGTRTVALQPSTPLQAANLYYSILSEQEAGTQWVVRGVSGESRWLAGWEWRNPEMTDTSVESGPPFDIGQSQFLQAPEDGRYIRAYFLQYQMPITTDLELTAGLRHDDYSDFGEHSSPRVALVQQLGKQDSLKLLYSEAFRAPSRIETSTVASAAFKSNPLLRPETAKTTEVMWLHTTNNGYVSATLFDSQINNAIEEIFLPPAQRSWVNDYDTLAGLEIEWQIYWNDRWQSRIGVTDVFDGIGAMHTEANTLLGGSLSYQDRGWTSSLLVNYQGRKRDPNEQDGNFLTTEYTNLGGRTVCGAHLSKLIVPDLEFYLHADNLFDRQYRAPANSPRNYVGVPGTGRVLTAGMRWDFD